jgi:hypothetical protein
MLNNVTAPPYSPIILPFASACANFSSGAFVRASKSTVGEKAMSQHRLIMMGEHVGTKIIQDDRDLGDVAANLAEEGFIITHVVAPNGTHVRTAILKHAIQQIIPS